MEPRGPAAAAPGGAGGEVRPVVLGRLTSLPDQLVYCEHGNQLDPTNTIADYANPLDTPVGAHVVSEVVRPIGSGAAITRSVDLQAVSYVFPIAARVMATAAPGEILTSSTVRDLVVGSDITMTDRGPHPLKGVDGTWQLFAASP